MRTLQAPPVPLASLENSTLYPLGPTWPRLSGVFKREHFLTRTWVKRTAPPSQAAGLGPNQRKQCSEDALQRATAMVSWDEFKPPHGRPKGKTAGPKDNSLSCGRLGPGRHRLGPQQFLTKSPRRESGLRLQRLRSFLDSEE